MESNDLPLFQGVLQAFKGPLIHSFNKRDGAVSHVAAHGELQGRPNVLLLGDSMGDLTMADGLPEHQNILTIGFLNDQVRTSLCFRQQLGFWVVNQRHCLSQVEARKESYVNAFDVVLVKDETMDVPNAILRYITSSRGNNEEAQRLKYTRSGDFWPVYQTQTLKTPYLSRTKKKFKMLAVYLLSSFKHKPAYFKYS